MAVFLISFLVILAVVLAMSIGRLLGRDELRGGCGALVGMNGGSRCAFCARPCRRRQDACRGNEADLAE